MNCPTLLTERIVAQDLARTNSLIRLDTNNPVYPVPVSTAG
jgi:hypothetical protein